MARITSRFQGITRNRTRICLGVTGAETCRHLKEFLTDAGSTAMAHIHNLGEKQRSQYGRCLSGNSIQVVTGQTGASVNVGAMQRAVRWNGNV